MSMMGGTESVNVDFNVAGNYGSTLSQMIAQADVYAKSADTMIGKIGKLNVVSTTLLQKTTALTQANKVATAEAAAYQQKLEKIEGTTKITGQSFGELEKSTLKLARSLPGGINEAVRAIEALQTSGVTVNKQLAEMAKTTTTLSYATGLDGPGLGKQLIELGRTFGNSDQQMASFADSLVKTTTLYGASADGALGFAKALAPVASSVGVTESAVIGLGTAAARLGEDGYSSATAFNRVLLDMSQSIRWGTPEIREYAAMLDMSSTALADLFKSDPTEVLIRFTEAIKKGGPEAQRCWAWTLFARSAGSRPCPVRGTFARSSMRPPRRTRPGRTRRRPRCRWVGSPRRPPSWVRR
jgi:hypothetical protein